LSPKVLRLCDELGLLPPTRRWSGLRPLQFRLPLWPPADRLPRLDGGV